MENKLDQLKIILGEVADLYAVANLLEWDQHVYMPPGGAKDRGSQLAIIQKLAHTKFTSPEVGQLLEDLSSTNAGLEPASDEARLLTVTRRDYLKAAKVPTEWVAEFARVTAAALPAWQAARVSNDFSLFLPHLERIVQLRREYAQIFQPYDHIYDPLLDDNDPGLKTADVQAIFAELRPHQVELIQAIAARPQVNDRFLHQEFDQQKQWEFGVMVVTRMGYDWQRGRQDLTIHPFCTSFGLDDVRITTRFIPNYFPDALAGSIHETGHALYEQGIDHKLARTPLASIKSMSLHESQSRMWEHLVGSSLPFWEYFYPRLQGVYPSQLGSVSLEDFYKGYNLVQPSFIRIEADEATYNLHVMLRLELEIALMEGSLLVKELPDAWRARMQEYLGITPPDDVRGVLQDIHWAGGSFGYFPTYALGNLISVQLWERIQKDIPDLDDQFRRGDFAALLGWLREKVHRHGGKFEVQELVQQVTGKKIDPAPYIRYLRRKFGQIYGV